MTKSVEELSQQYQKKTDHQHILENGEMYIGSLEEITEEKHVYDNTTLTIKSKEIRYIPALYKLFDEGIVNSRDHIIRMLQIESSSEHKHVTYIKIEITEDGTISFENDGNGIDIVIHPEHNIWIPEMIFGHLRTSTNYTKEKRIVGGINGLGGKLCFIWSTYGKIETVDHIRGLKYVQEFSDNLYKIHTPTISKAKNAKPYTKITFRPDYARLGLSKLSDDMKSLFHKRTLDIAGITNKKIRMFYNGTLLDIKNFQQYIDLYLDVDAKRVTESSTDGRWEYCIGLSTTHQFEQVSFVNGISTVKGGRHVDYIISQIVNKLQLHIKKKKKIVVNANSIKEQLILFLRCDIENPLFDSQTKDCLTTTYAKFGSMCNVSDNYIEKIAKLGVMEKSVAISEVKDIKLAKKTDGSKTKTVNGIVNLMDAYHAGTSQGKNCVLILCEGLSAMSGVLSGLSGTDRECYGIYPLKGKVLNVRGEVVKRIAENKEIADLKRILGLETGKTYKTINDVYKCLRYSKVMIMTDADNDGIHIRGLLVNLFHSEWPSLFRISGFLSFMNTPILRAKRGNQILSFYNDGEFITWKNSMNGCITGWTMKYLKGLGSSTCDEFKEYFKNKKIVDFVYEGECCDDIVDKIFNKKRSDERKVWLENYDKRNYLNTSKPTVSYEEFVNNELIHFSAYDCERNIPNVMDGLKTSQRKIIWCAFKRDLTAEIKVAQLSGYISEHSHYLHGEKSLHTTTISMAQDFLGSNNINLLEPHGQFGSRLQGGDDSASERYIFTKLNPLSRYLIHKSDDAILDYVDSDNHIVEPTYYVPIIPFVLINGTSGIGTGFSTNIPPFSPSQIIECIRNKLNNVSISEETFLPYYEGFKGSVLPTKDSFKFIVKGLYTREGENSLRITELPVGTWTMAYLTFLETLQESSLDKLGKKTSASIKSFLSTCTDTTIDIQITFLPDKINELEAENVGDINGIEKLLRLTSSVTTTNMHLFDKDCKLHKYTNVLEIIEEFYQVRFMMYVKRKEWLHQELSKNLRIVDNKAKYIQYVLDDVIDLRRKSNTEITELLNRNFLEQQDNSYDYLIRMSMNSVSRENVDKLMLEKKKMEDTVEKLQMTSIKQMWLHDIDQCQEEYNTYRNRRKVTPRNDKKRKSSS